MTSNCLSIADGALNWKRSLWPLWSEAGTLNSRSRSRSSMKVDSDTPESGSGSGGIVIFLYSPTRDHLFIFHLLRRRDPQRPPYHHYTTPLTGCQLVVLVERQSKISNV